MQNLVDNDEVDTLRQAADDATVAVIVVHGVADQQPGETARAFVELMVASAPSGARYVAGDQESFTLPVPPMEFRFAGEERSTDSDEGLKAGATPTAHERGLWKALKQSIRSDFHRPAGDAAETATAGSDRGLAFTRYLLCKSLRNEAPASHYTSQKTRLTRHSAAGDAKSINVYEMYWADQSRLAGAMPRILTELFTMFFRLSRLGRDAVDEASRHAGANRTKSHRGWSLLSWLQTTIDWAFTNLLAQLFFQLLLVGVFVVVLGAVAPEPGSGSAQAAAAALVRLRYAGGAVVILALLAAWYFTGAPRRVLAALACALIGVGLIAAPAAGFGVALLALLTAVYLQTLRWADDRFPFVLFSGRVIWLGLVGAALVRVAWQSSGWSAWDVLLSAGLTAFEFVLFAIKWWFIVFGIVIAVWALVSAWLTVQAAVGKDWQRRGSAATGRMGALVSLASFLLVAMALWAALGSGLELSLKGDCHAPAVWKEDVATAAAAAPSAAASGAAYKGLRVCDANGGDDKVDAASFAQHRFVNSTETFALNALLLAVVMGYLVLLLAPSLLAELQIVTSGSPDEARRLGTWLTWFYRYFDRVVLSASTVGAIAVVLVAFFFLRGSSPPDMGWMSTTSGSILRWFVLPAASALAVFTALGGILSRWAPGLRAPLDAALDVDNYMREFPRRAIPRARIFARYAALLGALRERGYQRIVVVAHSQGTVISAELLRYLSSQSTARAQSGRTRRLKDLLGCESIHMLTLGCPLRQLYAARFPTLYEWVLDHQRRPNGPIADDIGVDRWFNAFGSGDYVGRWLWSEHADSFHPLNDGLGHGGGLGRLMTYDDFKPLPPTAGALRSHNELETCIGFAAHTHYFDPPHKAAATQTVALLADELIAG